MTGVIDDRYELGARLGSGGSADVYEARDRRLDRRVACKILRADVPDPRVRERFRREALAAASLTHPNVVAVYDVGEDQGRPYLVMELVDGPSLATILARQGRLPIPTARDLAGQVLAGLAAAHRRGLVHRDVKPGNVLIATDGTAKLADFGIAKAVADATAALTATGHIVGTARYLAPEQVAGGPVDARTDVYAVGVVLYEMLAGSAPFTGEHALAVALQHQRDPVPPLATRRPDVPPDLVAIVERALAKDPADRFPDAEAMRRALTKVSDAAAATDRTEPIEGDLSPSPTRTLTQPRYPPVLPPTGVDEAGAHKPSSVPRPDVPDRRRGQRALLAAGAVALAAILAYLATSGSAGERTNSGRTSSGATGPAATTVPSAPASAPPTRVTVAPATPRPTTLSELIALVAANPSAYGKRGTDLLKRLEEAGRAQGGPGKGDDKKTEKSIADIQRWIADGELDAVIGQLAIQFLRSG